MKKAKKAHKRMMDGGMATMDMPMRGSRPVPAGVTKRRSYANRPVPVGLTKRQSPANRPVGVGTVKRPDVGNILPKNVVASSTPFWNQDPSYKAPEASTGTVYTGPKLSGPGSADLAAKVRGFAGQGAGIQNAMATRPNGLAALAAMRNSGQNYPANEEATAHLASEDLGMRRGGAVKGKKMRGGGLARKGVGMALAKGGLAKRAGGCAKRGVGRGKIV